MIIQGDIGQVRPCISGGSQWGWDRIINRGNGGGVSEYAGSAARGDYVLPVRLLLSEKGDWAWMTCSLWPPSEDGVFGESAWGESTVGEGQKLHIPLYWDPYQQRFCPQ